VEVVRQFPREALPPGVFVKDFGTRGYDLAYALADNFDTAILVDAIPRGDLPGSVYLVEPDLEGLGGLDRLSVSSHGMGPSRALQMAKALGGCPARVYFVACEPASLDSDQGQVGLSGAGQAAVPRAIEMIQELVGGLLESETNIELGARPV
jgi:hydrogenase maturation protease